RRSATICTARTFSSSGYRLDDFDPTCPSFPTEELSRHAGVDQTVSLCLKWISRRRFQRLSSRE
ncbi:hypothetical protein, partial [Mycobacterium sp. ZZG]